MWSLPTAANVANTSDHRHHGSLFERQGDRPRAVRHRPAMVHRRPLSDRGGARRPLWRHLHRNHGGHGDARRLIPRPPPSRRPPWSIRAPAWYGSRTIPPRPIISYGKSAVPQGTSIVGAPTPITTASRPSTRTRARPSRSAPNMGVMDGKLGVSGSVFDETKSNALQTDPVSGNVTLQSSQKQRVQGFEFSATGEVADAPQPDRRLYLSQSGRSHTYDLSLRHQRHAAVVCKPNPTPSASRSPSCPSMPCRCGAITMRGTSLMVSPSAAA